MAPKKEERDRWGLTLQDRYFCELIEVQGFDPGDAYCEAYRTPQDGEDRAKQLAYQRLNWKKIRNYMMHLQRPLVELAEHTEREALVSGPINQRRQIAKEVIARSSKEAAKTATDFWVAKMREYDARIEKPVPIEGGARVSKMDISFSDVMQGGARMMLPKDGLLRLLRDAGAPWNEKDPTATISPLQEEILLRREKVVCLHGGSGVGKSAFGGMVGVKWASLPNTKVAVIGATYDHAASEFGYIMRGMRALWPRDAFTDLTYKLHKTHQVMVLGTIWQSSVQTFSLDRDSGSQLYGKEFDAVILCEGSRIASDTWWRAIYRALQRRAMRTKLCDCPEEECNEPEHYWKWETGYAFVATTPDGHRGASSSIFDHVDRLSQKTPERLHYGSVPFQDSFYIREASCLENPGYDPDAFYAAERNLPHDVFAEQYLGRRVRRSGLVVREYSERRHLQNMPPRDRLTRMRFGVGVDTGKHYAAVLIGMETDRTKWVLGEAKTLDYNTRDNALETMWMLIQRVGCLGEIELDVDPTSAEAVREKFEPVEHRIEFWYCDSASQVKYDLLEEMPVPFAFEKPEVEHSISLLNRCFKEGSLYIARDPETGESVAPNLSWELDNWLWRLLKRPDQADKIKHEPEGKNNHSIDALRYILKPMEEAGPMDVRDLPSLSVEQAYRHQMEKGVLNWRSGVTQRSRTPVEALRRIW